MSFFIFFMFKIKIQNLAIREHSWTRLQVEPRYTYAAWHLFLLEFTDGYNRETVANVSLILKKVSSHMVITLWIKFFQETNWFGEFDFTKIQNDQLWDFEEAEKSYSSFVLMRDTYNKLFVRSCDNWQGIMSIFRGRVWNTGLINGLSVKLIASLRS